MRLDKTIQGMCRDQISFSRDGRSGNVSTSYVIDRDPSALNVVLI